ncbi:MAG: transketolase family protein [Candidatus Taylorbacteria bacterium]|nr:transketolase family protein [Candidatus Taylorbacteria bacterium]
MHEIINLNENLFETDVEKETTRKGVSEGLLLAGQADPRVVVLTADLADSTGVGEFRNKFPERFIDVGVAEQNLVTVASGLASAGKIPFASSYAVFNPGRNWEQIRTTICYNNQPVKIIGSHGGVTVGADGASHQMLEDVALMRVLPRMIVLSPCDAIETKKAIIESAKIESPVYIRTDRDKTPIITSQVTPFEIGKARIFFKPKVGIRADVGIIATGPLLYEALLVAKELSEKGKNVKVLNISTIKPLDRDAILLLAHEAKALVTVENHQIAGGLGSAVAECLATEYPVPIEFIGVHDAFGQSGTPAELIKHYSMTKKDIIQAVNKVVLRKN